MKSRLSVFPCVLGVALAMAPGCQKDKMQDEADLASTSADLSSSSGMDLLQESVELVAGQGTASVRMGDPLSKAKAALGTPSCMPDPGCATPQGFALVQFSSGISGYFGSEGATLSDDAVLLALWTQNPKVKGPGELALGQTKEEAVSKAGAPDTDAGPVLSYSKGLSLVIGKDNKVSAIAVFAPYRTDKAVPEMDQAAMPPSLSPSDLSWPRYKLDGEEIDVVDLHLHPGSFGGLGPGQLKVLPQVVPPFLLPILPAFVNTTGDLHAPGVGLASQARRFGFHHLGLFAVWAPNTVGWMTNTDVSKALYDNRNGKRPDGKPLAWGFASIRWDKLTDLELQMRRCAALESFLSKQGERFIGIKLAHTHQGVQLADARTNCVYELAKRYKKPVALHTGKTPTEGALDEPEAYDPKFLETTVKTYPEVTFVLLHVGQGDRRATNSALDLAVKYKNVALELSALGRPMLINEKGEMVMTMEPQFPYVLAEIKARNLVDRTLWASDGPQTPGFAASYRDRLVMEMKNQGYSKDQLKAVLAGNFYRLFGL